MHVRRYPLHIILLTNGALRLGSASLIDPVALLELELRDPFYSQEGVTRWAFGATNMLQVLIANCAYVFFCRSRCTCTRV